tara:strand:- start:247 stop:459 length:213 start_codon:yes stop_codon:yes gene_type:complete
VERTDPNDDRPSAYIAAVSVVVASSDYLLAIDRRKLDTAAELSALRAAVADYRDLIEQNARYTGPKPERR